MFDTETEVVDYCKYIVKCLADENYCELESKGILEIVPEEDLKRVLKEYDKDKKIPCREKNSFGKELILLNTIIKLVILLILMYFWIMN